MDGIGFTSLALVQRLLFGSGPAAEVEATTVWLDDGVLIDPYLGRVHRPVSSFSLDRIVVAAANVVLVEVEIEVEAISITTFPSYCPQRGEALDNFET